MTTPALRVLHLAGAAYLATGAVGSWVSLRDDLVGEPLGRGTGFGVRRDLAVGWGAALGAPWPLVAVATWALRRSRRSARGDGVDRPAVATLVGVAVASLAGIAAEPIATQVAADPSAEPQHTALVVAYLAVPAVVAAAGLRALAAGHTPAVPVTDRS